MLRLREQQSWLASLVLEPERLATSGTLLERVTQTDAATARERLAVYVDGYPARLVEALDEAYPAVRHVVGDGAFVDLVHRYATSVPVGIYSLTDAGAELPTFLRSDLLSSGLPMLSDLAALEWRILRAFHAEEGPPFDPVPLAQWRIEDWESARVRFQPSVSLLRSAWPVHDLWEHRETPIADIDLDVVGRPQDVLIHRAGWSVDCELVDAPRAVVLESLLSGQRLGESLELLAATSEEVADVSAWFASWSARGLIVECRRGLD